MTTQNGVKYGAMCAGLAAVILLSSCRAEQNSGIAEIHQGDHLTSFSQEITSPVHQFHVKAGGSYTVDINVKNTGTQPWFGGGQAMTVAASYRWLDNTGNILPIEGNRAQLDRPVVRPGESDALKLQVVPPPDPGSYTLRISMVQEGVNWFFERGAKTLDLQATVE